MSSKSVLMARWFVFCFIILSVSSCVTVSIPVQEYSLAKAAYEAAITAESAKYAPQLFYKAEKAYKRGEQLYKERDFEGARIQFVTSQKLSEKAEDESRVKQFNSGEEGG
jgi:hypothetical protein